MAGGSALQQEKVLAAMGAAGNPWQTTVAHNLNRNGVPIAPDKYRVESILVEDGGGWRAIPTSCAVVIAATVNDITVEMAPGLAWNDPPTDALVEVTLEDVHTIIGFYQQVALGSPPPAFNAPVDEPWVEDRAVEIADDSQGRILTDEWDAHDFLVDPNGPNGWTASGTTEDLVQARFDSQQLQARLTATNPAGNLNTTIGKTFETRRGLPAIAHMLLAIEGTLTLHASGGSNIHLYWGFEDPNSNERLRILLVCDAAGQRDAHLEWDLSGINGSDANLFANWDGNHAFKIAYQPPLLGYWDNVGAAADELVGKGYDIPAAAAAIKTWGKTRDNTGEINVFFRIGCQAACTADLEVVLDWANLEIDSLEPLI